MTPALLSNPNNLFVLFLILRNSINIISGNQNDSNQKKKKNTVTKASHMEYSPLRKSMLGFDSKNHFVSAFSCQKHKLWNAVIFYPSLLCLCQKTHRQIPLPHFDNMPSLGAWCPLLLMLLLSGGFNLVLCALEIVYTSVCVWDEYAHNCMHTLFFWGGRL